MFVWRVHGVCVSICVCGVDGVWMVAWCVQVKRMIRGSGNVLFSTNSQTLNGSNRR